MRIAIGSTNPAKVKAVEAAFHDLSITVTLVPCDVSSGVSPQPFSDEETIQGAINRAQNALRSMSNGEQPFDYGVGLEGGLKQTPHGLFLCNWVAIAHTDGRIGLGGGLQIRIPDSLKVHLDKGDELGKAIEIWSGKRHVSTREGAIGILTKQTITRTAMFRDAVICAFSRFMIS